MEIPIFTRLSHLVTFFFVIIAIIVAGCENNNGGGASGAFGAGILKGWYENGYPQEKIYDLALSDGRIADLKTRADVDYCPRTSRFNAIRDVPLERSE